MRETLAKSNESLALNLFLFFEFLKFVRLKTENESIDWKVFFKTFFFVG